MSDEEGAAGAAPFHGDDGERGKYRGPLFTGDALSATPHHHSYDDDVIESTVKQALLDIPWVDDEMVTALRKQGQRSQPHIISNPLNQGLSRKYVPGYLYFDGVNEELIMRAANIMTITGILRAKISDGAWMHDVDTQRIVGTRQIRDSDGNIMFSVDNLSKLYNLWRLQPDDVEELMGSEWQVNTEGHFSCSRCQRRFAPWLPSGGDAPMRADTTLRPHCDHQKRSGRVRGFLCGHCETYFARECHHGGHCSGIVAFNIIRLACLPGRDENQGRISVEYLKVGAGMVSRILSRVSPA